MTEEKHYVTVGDLRAALEDVGDDVPVVIDRGRRTEHSGRVCYESIDFNSNPIPATWNPKTCEIYELIVWHAMAKQEERELHERDSRVIKIS